MINILSVKCSLAFAPYLLETMSALEAGQTASSLTVRQGGSGLVLERGNALSVMHRNRRADLDSAAISHYVATVRLRAKSYEISRMSEEVVLASVNGDLLLSYPQSEIWLEQTTARHLAAAYSNGKAPSAPAIPDWLGCSIAAGRLLLSDQRTGRWVLLGRDHIAEFERRIDRLKAISEHAAPAPPVIFVKGIEIHLQSAFKLARMLRDFGQTRQVRAYEEAAPEFRLGVVAAMEGIQLSGTNARAGITAREATKWAGIIEAELTRLNANEITRGEITTVIADAPGGKHVLQWGDEVFVPAGFWNGTGESDDRLVHARDGELSVFLDRAKSACVAVTSEEVSVLHR